MSQNFFEISSPRDMLEKAKREFNIMEANVNTDAVFNFFVTTYHVMDYIKAQGNASRVAIDQMYADDDFEMCNFICNKGKHIRLRRGDAYQTKQKPGAVFGEAVWGEVMFGEGESYVIVDSNQEIDVLDLGKRLIQKWEKFFSDNGV